MIDGEKLAFDVRVELGEMDIPIIFSEPNRKVVEVLMNSKNVDELISNLPCEL